MGVRKGRELDRAERHPALVGRQNARQAVQQGRFARAGRAHDGGEFAAFETHVHAAQGMDHIAASAVVLDQVDGLNSDAARCGRVLHVHNVSPYLAGPYARMMIPTYEEITARPIVRQTELGGRPRAGPHP